VRKPITRAVTDNIIDAIPDSMSFDEISKNMAIASASILSYSGTEKDLKFFIKEVKRYWLLAIEEHKTFQDENVVPELLTSGESKGEGNG
jgi:hypothetical protein